MKLAECKEICYNILKESNIELTCPIRYNGRLKAVLGRVTYSSVGVPSAIEFSTSFMEEGPEEEVLNTIKHELAHYIVAKETGECHAHDNLFVAECEKLHCSFVGEAIDKDSVPTYKYALYCAKCGKLIRYYKREGKTVKNINYYTSACCGSGIRVEKLY